MSFATPPIRRIFCIGKNYAAHVDELKHLGHAPDGECVIFMKPPSAVVAPRSPIVLPRGPGSVHHEAELVVMLSGGGRDIAAADALQWVIGVTLGLDLTLRELQTTLKDKGKPWELAKAFDCSAPLGEFQPWTGGDLQALEFTCTVNGVLRQHGRTAEMLYPVAQQISILSQSWALAAGDVIYTGTPRGVAALLPGDEIQVEGHGLGRFSWRCE